MARLYGRLLNTEDLDHDDYWLVELVNGVGDAEAFGLAGIVRLSRAHVTRRQKQLGRWDAYYCPIWLCERLRDSCEQVN